ncbi:MFS transporter [Pseudonocardia sp. H11422]|uniref:MFS transporter n=1 Tax=Pseudonocardia sp. H11422 TaxID=2835866 RepID=UPI001BDD44D9|nr:MFS transporter [Pseudonocardia sp. H11422]
MHDDAVSTAVVDRATRTPDRDRGRWTSVAALGIGATAIGTDMFVVAGVLAGLAGDLGVTVGAAGLTVTVFALAYAIGAPLLSALLGARPLRQVLIGSLVLFGLFNAMSVVAPTLPVLLTTRVLGALAASVYVPAAGAAAVAAVPASHRGRALGVILGGASIAMVLGAPLGVLLAAMLSWRAAFGLVAVLAAVTALGLLLSSVGSGPLIRSTVRERLRPMRSRAVVVTLAVTFLVMTASNSTYTYLAVLLGDAAGPVGLGLFIGAFGLGGMVGTWWGGIAADRGGSRRVVLLAVTVLTTGFAVLPLVATTVAGALTVVVGWGIAAWGFVPAQQHRLIGLGVGPAPLLLALNSSATHLGFAAGALLGGIAVDAAGAGLLWLPAVVCCGAGLTLHIFLTRKDQS